VGRRAATASIRYVGADLPDPLRCQCRDIEAAGKLRTPGRGRHRSGLMRARRPGPTGVLVSAETCTIPAQTRDRSGLRLQDAAHQALSTRSPSNTSAWPRSFDQPPTTPSWWPPPPTSRARTRSGTPWGRSSCRAAARDRGRFAQACGRLSERARGHRHIDHQRRHRRLQPHRGDVFPSSSAWTEGRARLRAVSPSPQAGGARVGLRERRRTFAIARPRRRRGPASSAASIWMSRTSSPSPRSSSARRRDRAVADARRVSPAS